jgi:acylphosphatase
MTADASLDRRLVAIVHGRVQGVGFRWFIQREASRLNATGWVDNRLDGSVEVVAEGAADALESLLQRLREGPAGSAVSNVDVRYEPARGHMSGFDIRSGAHPGD